MTKVTKEQIGKGIFERDDLWTGKKNSIPLPLISNLRVKSWSLIRSKCPQVVKVIAFNQKRY